MKALFGTVSLLVALAVVGLLAVRQLHAPITAKPQGLSPVASASANVATQARQLEQQVKSDIAHALEQGAAARREAAEP